MPKHGMQMGSSGFGLTHGYGDGDEVDNDVEHEYKGHGISEDMIRKAASGASHERIGKFAGRMERRHDATGKKLHQPSRFSKARDVADSVKRSGRISDAGKKAYEAGFKSGWDRWRAKKGHGMSSYEGGDCGN